jgi:hypothetical protein
VDHQAEFDAMLKDIHVEVHLRGGWFAQVSIWSDARPVVASWWGVEKPVLDIGYSQKGLGDSWKCQPQYRANDPYAEDGSHCASLTHECACTDGGKRCDCAAELLQLPDHLYLFPSTELVNGGPEGWNVTGAGIVVELENADAAVVKYVDFVAPEPSSPLPASSEPGSPLPASASSPTAVAAPDSTSRTRACPLPKSCP